LALTIKNQYVFPLAISNGKRYIALQNVLQGTNNQPSILSLTRQVEQQIQTSFAPLYAEWLKREISDEVFYTRYEQLASQWFDAYQLIFSPYLNQ
jgi:hypothetical protein